MYLHTGLKVFLTAWPGLFKILTLLVVKYIWGTNSLGEFGGTLGLINFFVLLGSSGLASIVIVRVKEQIPLLKYVMLLFIFSCLSIPFLFLMFELGEVLLILILILLWGMYVLVRSYSLALADIRFLLLLEIFSFVVFIALLFYGYSPLKGLVAYYCLSVVAMCYRYRIDFTNNDEPLFKLSLQLSISNLISSGVVFLIPFIALELYSSEFAAVISLSLSVAMLIGLLPRAISYNYLPILRGLENVGGSEEYKQFKNKAYLAIAISALSCSIAALALNLSTPTLFGGDGGVYVFLSGIIMVSIIQLSFPYYCLLQVLDDSFASLLSNVMAVVGVIVITFLSNSMNFSELLFIVSLSVVYMIRHFSLFFYVRKEV